MSFESLTNLINLTFIKLFPPTLKPSFTFIHPITTARSLTNASRYTHPPPLFVILITRLSGFPYSRFPLLFLTHPSCGHKILTYPVDHPKEHKTLVSPFTKTAIFPYKNTPQKCLTPNLLTTIGLGSSWVWT